MDWKVPYIDLGKQYTAHKEEIDEAVEKVHKTGRYILGYEAEEFEKEIAKYIGCKHAIGLNSGTDALIFALRAYGIREGEEVITTPWTFVATVAAIKHVGATPILVDIDADYCIDVNKIEEVVTERAGAIVPVHLNGRMCQMDIITELAEGGNIAIVEDACQALGAEYKGEKAGTFGVGCFSFHPLKVICGVGDGGLLTTNIDWAAEQVRLMRDHGQVTKECISKFGYNSRLDAISAAVLRVKVKYLEGWILRRRLIAEVYCKELQSLDWIGLPIDPDRHEIDRYDTFNSYVVRIYKDRDKFREYLRGAGIETLVNWAQPWWQNKSLGLDYKGQCPLADQLTKEVISLPIYPEMSDDQIQYVIDTVRRWK